MAQKTFRPINQQPPGPIATDGLTIARRGANAKDLPLPLPWVR